MKSNLELIRYTRNNIMKLVGDLTVEQFNSIPEGFNNNIIWNLAHMIYTQQSMCYKLGGLSPKIDITIFGAYASGTFPQGERTAAEINLILETFSTILSDFENDLNAKLFTSYRPWSLHDQLMVDNIDDAIAVTAVHEGRHFGVITSLKTLII